MDGDVHGAEAAGAEPADAAVGGAEGAVAGVDGGHDGVDEPGLDAVAVGGVAPFGVRGVLAVAVGEHRDQRRHHPGGDELVEHPGELGTAEPLGLGGRVAVEEVHDRVVGGELGPVAVGEVDVDVPAADADPVEVAGGGVPGSLHHRHDPGAGMARGGVGLRRAGAIAVEGAEGAVLEGGGRGGQRHQGDEGDAREQRRPAPAVVAQPGAQPEQVGAEQPSERRPGGDRDPAEEEHAEGLADPAEGDGGGGEAGEPGVLVKVYAAEARKGATSTATSPRSAPDRAGPARPPNAVTAPDAPSTTSRLATSAPRCSSIPSPTAQPVIPVPASRQSTTAAARASAAWVRR